MWLLEFIFGMFLAYLIIFPQLRHFIFRQNHTTNIQTRIGAEEKRKHNTQPSPKTPRDKNNFPEDLALTDTHGKVVTTEDEVAKWLHSNSELRVKD